MKLRVLVTRDLPEPAVRLLSEAGFEVTSWKEERTMTPEELVSAARQHDALLCSLTDSINATFLNTCQHLKVISQFGVGFDNIDVATATQLGIPVGNTPDVLTDATADVAFGLMLAVSRKMFFLHKTIAQGKWSTFRPKGQLGMELRGKTLGVVGLGRIGQAMARRCARAYDMPVVYHNRQPIDSSQLDFTATWLPFDPLLATSDVVSVHCALTPATRGLFDRNVFRKMKQTAIFINTARGLIHQEADLIEALQSGTIWGAGLDVTNPEPMLPDNPLLSMENVAILPHIGSATQEARSAMARLAAENIIAFFATGKVPHQVKVA